MIDINLIITDYDNPGLSRTYNLDIISIMPDKIRKSLIVRWFNRAMKDWFERRNDEKRS